MKKLIQLACINSYFDPEDYDNPIKTYLGYEKVRCEVR